MDESSTGLQVRTVGVQEIQPCLELLQTVGRWIEEQGRVQRVARLSPSTYAHWQAQGFNYLVSDRGRLAGIFSLPIEPFDKWNLDSFPESTTWLRTLAIHPDFRGRGIGRFAVQSALELAEPHRPVFLDCVSGFLPDYYSSLGFEVIAEQMQLLDDGTQLPVTLMAHRNGGELGVKSMTTQ